ncbi:MAG: hypothetical protein JWR15_2025 [Prosthecobacter sp.]|nr:hypothetical protein [Prosthecobacter sp.]
MRLWVACGCWLVAILAGLFFLLRYAESPGTAGVPPAKWPDASAVSHDLAHPTLVLFLHPQCPCSRATIGELELLMTQCQGKVTAHVWFLKPAEMTESWVKTDLWRSAEAIPGVIVHVDNGGTEARCFSAETSGQTLLYDRQGSLMFQGGITLSRGHAGDNPGRTAVTAMLTHQLSGPAKTPVFGCGLWDMECQQEEGECKH